MNARDRGNPTPENQAAQTKFAACASAWARARWPTSRPACLRVSALPPLRRLPRAATAATSRRRCSDNAPQDLT
eukprot:1020194-Pyramimonas_sp.AAC.1